MRAIVFIISVFISGNAFCQYLPADMRQELKGNISHATTTVYYQYPDGIERQDIVVFDKQGHFTKAMFYDTAKKISSDVTFQFDKSNRLISFKQYHGKIMEAKTVNYYNALDQVNVQYLYLYQGGYPNSRFRLTKYFFTYNKANQVIKIYADQYGVDIRPYNQYFTYNASGQKLTNFKEAYALNSAQNRTYAYNKNGDLIQTISTDPDAPIHLSDTVKYEYTGYDKAGNWLKKQDFHISAGKKEPGDITIRKVVYFKK